MTKQPTPPTYDDLRSAIGSLLDTVAQLDNLLDRIVSSCPEGLSRDEQKEQRDALKVRDKVAKIVAAAQFKIGTTKTNITRDARETFREITSGKYKNLALFSCFFDGLPTNAIVAVNTDGQGGFTISPLYIQCTDAVQARLRDHNGDAPAPQG